MSVTEKKIWLSIEAVLWVTFAIFSAALLAREFAGEIAGPPIAVHSPLNVESFTAVSFLLLVLIRSKSGRRMSALPLLPINPRTRAAAVIAITCLSVAAFALSLPKPFLFDDYGHVMLASRSALRDFLRAFYRPHQDIFFRPLGFLSFALDIHWAHFDPFRWHLWSLIVHTLNCILVFFIASQLRLPVFSSVFAAALFSIHGSRAEAVCWTDARFDLLAALFVLAAILYVTHYVRTPANRWLYAALVLSILGLFTKEAAFAVPFLLLALLPFYERNEQKRLLRIVPVFVVACALQFLYRLWMIGGIGGYQTGSHANVLTFSAIRSAKTLLWRLWALALFPINWSAQNTFTFGFSMLIFLLALGLSATKAAENRRVVAGSLLLVVAACLPVQHLLLLGADFAGSRLLYLPVFGIAIFWAVIAEKSFSNAYARYAMAAAVLLFNLCCLERNISNWTGVAEIAQNACRSFGQRIAVMPGKIRVVDLPVKHQGVFFLSDAFPDCVEMTSGVPASRLIVSSDGATDVRGTSTFRWDPELLRFEPVKKSGE